ncbi:hypothetical protein OUZ56_018715 [Daphnia magna]|uniref:Uncharacterized protein n=1 Tax=Daphnia magna TaxID=35525 RepID=A0ABQ9Z9N1_9CRUS|nr:hypothetical protein OUZ56_018715 [Daphnia magna]
MVRQKIAAKFDLFLQDKTDQPYFCHALAVIWGWSPQIPVRSLSCPVRTFNRSMYEMVRILQLGLRETVSKGRDRHPYIPVGLSRPSDWLSPSPHPIAPPPLLLVE